jgi:hypothetical protein
MEYCYVMRYTYLGASKQVAASSNNGNGIFLNGGWRRVSCITNVIQKDWIEGRAGEGSNRLRNPSTGGLYRNVFILFKVDTSVLF